VHVLLGSRAAQSTAVTTGAKLGAVDWRGIPRQRTDDQVDRVGLAQIALGAHLWQRQLQRRRTHRGADVERTTARRRKMNARAPSESSGARRVCFSSAGITTLL
jgi:hypothetical protein